MDLFQLDMGTYPNTLEDFLFEPTVLSNTSVWRGPYLGDLAPDPWGHPYFYLAPGSHNTGAYDLWSSGPDGVNETDDVGNWEVAE